MLADDAPGDGEAEPTAAGFAAAASLETEERLEDLLQRGLGQARAVIVDENVDAALALRAIRMTALPP